MGGATMAQAATAAAPLAALAGAGHVSSGGHDQPPAAGDLAEPAAIGRPRPQHPRRHHRRDRLRRRRAHPHSSSAIRNVRIVGLAGPRPRPRARRRRASAPGAHRPPHRGGPARRRGRLPGPAARRLRGARARTSWPGASASSTWAPTTGSRTRPTTRAGTASSTPRPSSSRAPSTACPSSIAPSSLALADAEVAIVGVAGLLSHDDAAGPLPARPGRPHRRPRRRRQERRLGRRSASPRRTSCSARSTRTCAPTASTGHRHIAEIEQELAAAGASPEANPGARSVDFLPHLVPMQRGILAASHVRPTRQVSAGRAARPLRARPTRTSPSWRSSRRRPATGQVRGSNSARVHVHLDERTGPDRRRLGHRQPRQGRRRPGRPGLQPRPRPARDGRPRAAAARSLSRPRVVQWPTGWLRDAAPGRCHPTCPRSSAEARLPKGFRAAGVPGRHQGVGRARTSASSSSTDRRRPSPARSPPTGAGGARAHGPRAPRAPPIPPATGRRGWVKAMLSTSGCANAATGEPGLADQRAPGRQPRRRGRHATAATCWRCRPGLIGTRLPVERVAAAIRRLRRERASQPMTRPGRGRRGAADDRFPCQGRRPDRDAAGAGRPHGAR